MVVTISTQWFASSYSGWKWIYPVASPPVRTPSQELYLLCNPRVVRLRLNAKHEFLLSDWTRKISQRTDSLHMHHPREWMYWPRMIEPVLDTARVHVILCMQHAIVVTQGNASEGYFYDKLLSISLYFRSARGISRSWNLQTSPSGQILLSPSKCLAYAMRKYHQANIASRTHPKRRN